MSQGQKSCVASQAKNACSEAPWPPDQGHTGTHIPYMSSFWNVFLFSRQARESVPKSPCESLNAC
jgi:hypothetical protein